VTHVFDRVILTEQGAPPRVMSRDEFVRLPIHLRVRYILERQVEFFLGPAPVNRAVALQSLRALNAERAKSA
jgi:hypothetical protein